MSLPNDFHLTSAEDTILVETSSECVPITPEVLQRPRKRAPWMLRDKDGLPLPPPDGPQVLPPSPEVPPDGPPA
jgi:hypothetical protein